MTPSPTAARPVTHRYADPLEVVWTNCALQVGFRVERSHELYASTDGKGTLLIGTDDILDADDSLAQMIFHELCHALIEGEGGERQVDWGLDNTSNRHLWREHACLRLQAYLAGNVGLRAFLAPTTDFRVRFWNALPTDPFAAAGGRREPSCVAARLGAWRATQPRWSAPLSQALDATAAIAGLVSAVSGAPPGYADEPLQPGDASGRLPLLWATRDDPPARHPAGHAVFADYHAGHGCADCAWSFFVGASRRCRHAPRVRVPDQAPACTRWEAADRLACAECGACCREAYHAVEVGGRETVNRTHPELVEIRETHRRLRRTGDRCAALAGGETPTEPFACTIYADRPRSCRDFERGGAHCLDARRRVGLSL